MPKKPRRRYSKVKKPTKVFSKVNKAAKSSTAKSSTVVVNTTPPAYGSKAALTKQSSYIIPRANFGNVSQPPTRRRSQRREMGYPGLNIFSGHVTEEFITELQGYRGIQIYEEMRRNDPVVGAMLNVAEQLIHNASLLVTPSPANPDAQESLMAADLVRTSLYDMGNTWTDTLKEILSFLAFGHSVMSVFHKKREGYKLDRWKSSRYNDGLWGWAGMSLRSQTSLESWETDDKGRAIGMWQQGPPTYKRVLVPFTHAAHFRTTTERENPMGVSVLRNAFRPWIIKKHLEEVEAIGVERDLTGLAVMTVPEGVDLWNPNDADAATTLERCENIVRLIRVDKYGGAVLPFGYDLKLLTTPGQRAQNADAIISRWDQRIAVTMLADMLLIGHERVGSFALVQSKVRLFSSALESYAARIAGVFNSQLIPRMMLLNGIPQEYWPEMKFGPVETPALLDMAEYIKALSDVGVNIDEPIALYLRQIANLPSPRKGEKAMVEAVPEEPPKKGEERPAVSRTRALRSDPVTRYSIGLEGADGECLTKQKK